MLLPFILVIACFAGMAACPCAAFVIARRKYRSRIAHRRKHFVVYYTVVAASLVILVGTVNLLYPITSGFGDIVATALASIAVAVLLAAVLGGPFVGLDMLQVAKALASEVKICLQCGYDLTGNISGVCPECGSPTETSGRAPLSVRQRLMSLPWRRVLPVWLLAVVLLTGLVGYVKATEAWICSECCAREFRVLHQFGLPFGGPVLFEVKGGSHRDSYRARPLRRLLDPDNECSHRWVGNGWSGEGLTDGWRGIGPDFCGSIVEYEPDFERFLNDHPDVLSRIRQSARQRECISEWLFDEYYGWMEDADGIEPGG